MTIQLHVGDVFSTPFEEGCVVISEPDEDGGFDGADSDGVVCLFHVSMVSSVTSPLEERGETGIMCTYFPHVRRVATIGLTKVTALLVEEWAVASVRDEASELALHQWGTKTYPVLAVDHA